MQDLTTVLEALKQQNERLRTDPEFRKSFYIKYREAMNEHLENTFKPKDNQQDMEDYNRIVNTPFTI